MISNNNCIKLVVSFPKEKPPKKKTVLEEVGENVMQEVVDSGGFVTIFHIMRLVFCDNHLFELFAWTCMSTVSESVNVLRSLFGDASGDRFALDGMVITNLVLKNDCDISRLSYKRFLRRLGDTNKELKVIERISEWLFLRMQNLEFFEKGYTVNNLVEPMLSHYSFVTNRLSEKPPKEEIVSFVPEIERLMQQCFDKLSKGVLDYEMVVLKKEGQVTLDLTRDQDEPYCMFVVFLNYVQSLMKKKCKPAELIQLVERWCSFLSGTLIGRKTTFLKNHFGEMGKFEFKNLRHYFEEFKRLVIDNPNELVALCCNFGHALMTFWSQKDSFFFSKVLSKECVPPQLAMCRRDYRFFLSYKESKFARNGMTDFHNVWNDKEDVTLLCQMYQESQVGRVSRTVGTFPNIYQMMLNAQTVKDEAIEKQKETDKMLSEKEKKKRVNIKPEVSISACPSRKGDAETGAPLPLILVFNTDPGPIDDDANSTETKIVLPGFKLSMKKVYVGGKKEVSIVVVYRKLFNKEKKVWINHLAAVIDRKGKLYHLKELYRNNGPKNVDDINEQNWSPGQGPLLTLLRILEAKPKESSAVIARFTGSCLACQRPMTLEQSLKCGFGPDCMQNLGLDKMALKSIGDIYHVNPENTVVSNAFVDAESPLKKQKTD